MRRRLRILAIGLLLLSACSAKDDADMIRAMIRESAELAEEKQIGALMRQAAPGFVALPGRHPADEVKSILFAAFMHYGRFQIHHPRPSVSLAPDGRRAEATVYFVIVRQDQALPDLRDLYEDPRQWLAVAGEKADLYQLKLELEKSDAQWAVTLAHLQGFKGLGF